MFNYLNYEENFLSNRGPLPRFFPTFFKAKTVVHLVETHGSFGLEIAPFKGSETGFIVYNHLRFYTSSSGLINELEKALESDPICIAKRTVKNTTSNKQLGISVSKADGLRGVVVKLLDPIELANQGGGLSPDVRISQQYRYWRAFLEINEYYRTIYGEKEAYPTKMSIFVAFVYYVTLVIYGRQYLRTPDKDWKKIRDLAKKIREDFKELKPGTAEEVDNLARLKILLNPPIDLNTIKINEVFPQEPMAVALLKEYQKELLYGGIDITDKKTFTDLYNQFFEPESEDLAWPGKEFPEAPFPFPENDPDYPPLDPNSDPWEIDDEEYAE